MNNSVGNNITVNQQPSKGKKVAGAVAGTVTTAVIRCATESASERIIIPKIGKIGQGLTEEEYGQIKNAIDVIKNKSHLAQKGVDIVTVTDENAKQVENMLVESLAKKRKFFPKKFFSNSLKDMTNITKKGENAFFESRLNKILIGEKKDCISFFFHEAGHAMNCNLNKITKLLQKCRSIQILTIPITFIALLHTDKRNENGEQSKLNKAGSFIKKHAAGLTFLSFLPMLAEEGLASLRGGKLAKQMVNPALLKKINKSNLLGFSTYLIMAVVTSLSTYFGVKVADKIRESKKNAKAQA